MNVTLLARSYYRNLPTFTQAVINFLIREDSLERIITRMGGIYKPKTGSQIDLRKINGLFNVLMQNFDLNNNYDRRFFNDYILDNFATYNLSNSDIMYSEVITVPKTILRAQSKNIKTVLYPGGMLYSWSYKVMLEEYKRFGFKDKYFIPAQWQQRRKKYALADKCVKMADYLFVASSIQADVYAEFGVPREKMICIPLGVDTSYFKPPDKRPPQDKFKAIFVGHGCLTSGIPYLLQAWEDLNLDNSELIIVGIMGEEFKNYYSYLENVRFLDQVPVDQVRSFYHECSVLVHPGISGPGARTVLEGLCCGLPAIVSENQGYKDLIQNNENGFVVPTRSANAISEKLKYLYDNPSELSRMSLNASVTGSENSFENYGKNMFNNLKKISEQNG